MFPSVQTIYGRMYFRFGNEKYYVFTDPSVTLSAEDMSVATCELPAAAAKAAKLDLRLGTLNIPYEPHPFKVSYGGLEITGETNAKLFPILFKYPQMPIGDYAESNLMPELRRSIVDQLKGQLEGKSRVDAVNTLLQFVQSGFEYATDHEYHGFEKPYFFEEILYYPKCDCEDRVIFYTYLLWNVLGVENHPIAYPGHESASVKLADIDKGMPTPTTAASSISPTQHTSDRKPVCACPVTAPHRPKSTISISDLATIQNYKRAPGDVRSSLLI